MQFWSKRRLEHLIQTKYAYLWDTWHGWDSEWIKQADAARYILMNEFGGIYMDMDYSCENPMDGIVAAGSIVINRGNPGREEFEYVDNSLMASTPHHWFWSNVLSELPVRARRNVLDATGPHMLHEVLYNVCGKKTEIKLDPFNRTYSDPDVEKYGITLTTPAMKNNVVIHHNTGTWLGLYYSEYNVNKNKKKHQQQQQ
jgi:mannosyltransferase OCH1-like enzyme